MIKRFISLYLHIVKKYLAYIFFIFLIPIYLFKLGKIPYGIFCDEAKIGYVAFKLINYNFNDFINPFFYMHFGYILGGLPIYATVPFVKLLGLSDFSVRLPSAIFAVSSLILIYLILRLLKQRYKLLIILLFASTPIFFHISRINFGHSPSLFFLLLGYFLYLIGKSKKSVAFLPLILSGLSFGVSAYGYMGFLISTPLLVLIIVVSEIIEYGLHLDKYKRISILLAALLVAYIPILFVTLTNPLYTKRIQDKNAGSATFFSIQKVQMMVKNYPKYYSYDFLFKTATIDSGEFISRHSVRGNGIFLPISLFFILSAFIAFVFYRNKNKIKFLPFILLFLLYPLPDLLTTKDGSPPYSFSIFSTIYFLPFLCSYGLNYVLDLLPKDIILKKTVLFLILIAIIIQANAFFENYNKYPLYSSDYWGWQSGPEEIIKYFVNNRYKYDELYMTGYFNQPDIFLSFYDPGGKCFNCHIGGINDLNLRKKQLFALRSVEMDDIKKSHPELIFKLVHKVLLPNGLTEYFIGYFK